MQTTVKLNNTTSPLWNQLRNLSDEDKIAIIAMLSQSMVETKQETFEEKLARSVSLEDFSKMCDEEIDRIYGED